MNLPVLPLSSSTISRILTEQNLTLSSSHPNGYKRNQLNSCQPYRPPKGHHSNSPSIVSANIAYHAGLRVAKEAANLEPFKIRGFVLHRPFFGGIERTDSEIRLAEATELTLSLNDLLWEFSLPIDANTRDHEYSNPLTGDGPSKLDQFQAMGWRVLLTGRFGDLLIDRKMEFAKVLEEKGVRIVTHFGEGYHGIESYDQSKAKELFGVVLSFLYM